jgi:hypothetical protein
MKAKAARGLVFLALLCVNLSAGPGLDLLLRALLSSRSTEHIKARSTQVAHRSVDGRKHS